MSHVQITIPTYYFNIFISVTLSILLFPETVVDHRNKILLIHVYINNINQI